MRWVGWLGWMALVVGGCTDRADAGDEATDEGEDSSGAAEQAEAEGEAEQGEVESDGADEDPGDDTTTGAEVPDLQRQWLLAVGTFLSPATPLQWYMTIDLHGTDTPLLDVQLQSLSLDVGSVTSPRQPVGDPLEFPNVPLADDGTFTLTIPMLTITGAANPITGSEIVAADVVLSGPIAGELWCGLADGQVTSPLSTPLTGSTFAAVPVSGLDALPNPVVAACP